MRCPACQHPDSRVVDSRDTGDAIRRRRSCLQCGHRFSTLERVELRLPWVVKKDGRREPFSRDKVFNGLALACRKRPVNAERLAAAVAEIEQALVELREPEVPSSRIGEVVMRVLQDLDDVAYVRFASVYRQFESVEQFRSILPGATLPGEGVS
jgi:transcriptional repressor NrdR